MFKQILLAVDGSEYSIRAAKEAIKIASLVEDSEIELVYVADFAKAKSEVLHAQGKADLEVTRRKRLAPIEELMKEANVAYKVTTLHGEPKVEIVNHANKGDYDILVIGSRGLNVFQEMVLGSVSHKVVKRANCPVLVVK